VTIRCDTARNTAVITMVGAPDKTAILAAFDAVVANPDYRRGMGRLWDFRAVDLSALPSGAVREMAHYTRRFPPGVKDVRVALVTAGDLEFGLSRMYEMTSDGETPVSVFRKLEDALDWLSG
jgi:hypothetical protein